MTTELVNAYTSGMTAVQEHLINTLVVIVPIALGIFAILFIWLYGINLFKRLIGSKRRNRQLESFYDDFDEEGYQDYLEDLEDREDD